MTNDFFYFGEIKMNNDENLKKLIIALNTQLNEKNNELDILKQRLKLALENKRNNTKKILEQYVPNNKMSTINKLRVLFTNFKIQTKRKFKIFEVADI
jgi:hypothetical protein